MDDVTRRYSHGSLPNEEKPVDSSREVVSTKITGKRAHHESEDPKSSLSEYNKDLSLTKQEVAATNNKDRSTMDSDSRPSSSSQKDQNNWVESARAEMDQVRQENQRLKTCLGQVMKDYQALQMKFYDIIQQDQETKKSSASTVDNNHEAEVEDPDHQFISLSLGRFSSSSNTKKEGKSQEENDKNKAEDLSLGLECKFELSKSEVITNESLPNTSPVNSLESPIKEEAGETWPSKKVSKTMGSEEDEVVAQAPLKKARVCVRAKCDTPTMSDGCQWRKYGQKIAKGNPCPRAYYRCTVAPSCPVRKQVQRCAEDMSILITTYEGTHNHTLPVSATAMASTTSAAASMLLSGSLSSSSLPNTSTIPADLHGLNFYLSDASNSRQFYLHNSSLSPSPSHPTIILDLTSSTSSSSSSSFNRSFSSSTYSPIPKFSNSGTLNFGSSESQPINWRNGFLSYGPNNSSLQSYNRNNHFQAYMQKKTLTPQQPPFPDPIAAATKAITTDPNFQSALAAALTSIISNTDGASGGGGSGDNLEQKLKWTAENFPVASGGYIPSGTAKGNNGCATSYLNKTTSGSPQPGNLTFLPPTFFSSSSKSPSSSPSDKRDHSN